MANFTRIEVFNEMRKSGIVPIFYHPSLMICKRIVRLCYNAGFTVFEFTNRGEQANLIFKELIQYVREEFEDLMLGIGAVVDASTAAYYIEMGADFVVSPILSSEMAIVCNRQKIGWIPGCGTLTEISNAESMGAEVIKIFPSLSVGGPQFVKDVKGPFPWTSIMPTGGVTTEKDNLYSWFQAGVHCVGIGSNLIPNKMINDENILQDYLIEVSKNLKEVRSNL